MPYAIGVLLLGGLVLVAAGCFSFGGKLKTPQVKMIADERLNCRNGESLDVVKVRLYLLTQDTEFLTGSYDELWVEDQLKDSEARVGRAEITVTADSKSTLQIPPDPGKEAQADTARYVGILAGYYDPLGEEWKQLVTIDPGKAKVSVELGCRGLSGARAK